MWGERERGIERCCGMRVGATPTGLEDPGGRKWLVEGLGSEDMMKGMSLDV